MKVIDNVKTGAKTTGGFIKKHWKAVAASAVTVLGAVGAVVGYKVAKGHQSDAPEATDESSDEQSEE